MKKKYILPAVKIFIAVVIAIALTKIAFFSGQEGQNQADISSGLEVTTRTTTATVGDITSTVEVKGQVVQDKAVEAKATLTGTVDSLTVAKDAMITQGEPLLYLKKTEPQEPKTDAEGNTVTPSDKVTWGTVYAPVSGKVTYNVIENQDTTTGMVVASVTPQTYSATGDITAAQQYRLTNAPAAATISTTDGPAPFLLHGSEDRHEGEHLHHHRPGRQQHHDQQRGRHQSRGPLLRAGRAAGLRRSEDHHRHRRGLGHGSGPGPRDGRGGIRDDGERLGGDRPRQPQGRREARGVPGHQ